MESQAPKKKKAVASSGVKTRVKKEKVEHLVEHKSEHGESSHVHETHTAHNHAQHVKKKIPAHITAASIFAAEFKKKIPSPFLTGVSIVMLIGVVFLYKLTNGAGSGNFTTDVSKKSAYVSSVYGFSFKLPTNYSQIRESPDPKQCLDNRTWDGKSLSSVTVAEIQNISVVVGCQNLSSDVVNQFAVEKVTTREISVGTRKAYIHKFVTATGYEWQVAQIPIDETHYLEISHNYKANPDLVAAVDLPGYKPLSESEWNRLIMSLAFK